MLLKKILLLGMMTICHLIHGQNLEPFVFSEKWLSEIETLAPETPTVKTDMQKHILIFSLHTGFEHWTIPHTKAVVQLISEKSNAYKITTSKDIRVFDKESLKTYDAIVLNNSCSKPKNRNIFLDVFSQDSSFTEKESRRLAKKMEANLLNFVKEGKGLIVLHGGITMLNKSKEFSTMLGGSFDYHPKQQKIEVHLADPKHPLVNAFKGGSFSHIDEPYFFNNGYMDTNFRPLLAMDASSITGAFKALTQQVLLFCSGSI